MKCRECGKELKLSKDFVTLFNICDYCGKINGTRTGGEINGN